MQKPGFKNQISDGAGRGLVAVVSVLWALFCRFLALFLVAGEDLLKRLLHRLTHPSPATSTEDVIKRNTLHRVVLGFTILLVSTSVVTCGTHTPDTYETYRFDGSKVFVVTPLIKNTPPYFPDDAYWDNPYEAKPFRVVFGSTYHYFGPGQQLVDGKLNVLSITDKGVCITAPSGGAIRFSSDDPPIYAANVEYTVTYMKSRPARQILGTAFFTERFAKLMHGEILVESSWEELYSNWSDVDRENFVTVRVLHQKDTPGKSPGGMVCF